jgi:hypothetical protein
VYTIRNKVTKGRFRNQLGEKTNIRMTALDDGIYTGDEELEKELEQGLEEPAELDVAEEPPPYSPSDEDGESSDY